LIQVYEVGRSRVLSPLNIETARDLIGKAKSFNRKH